jgi:hypothetical protein
VRPGKVVRLPALHVVNRKHPRRCRCRLSFESPSAVADTGNPTREVGGDKSAGGHALRRGEESSSHAESGSQEVSVTHFPATVSKEVVKTFDNFAAKARRTS